MKKKKHHRFGRRKRREGDPMPCWKQYTMLFLGTCMVGVCNVAAISWMATMQPLQANVRCRAAAAAATATLELPFLPLTPYPPSRRRLC